MTLKPLPTTLLASAATLAALLAPGPGLAGGSPLEAPPFVPAAPETLVVDSGHSSVLFSILHLGASRFYGRFNEVAGEIIFDEAEPANCQVEITVQASSLDTADKKRDQHARGPDFLDAKQFPTLSFKSEKISREGGLWKAEGQFEMHGVTQPVSFEFEKVGEGKGSGGVKVVGFHARFEIDRRDFGMDYMTNMLGTTLELIISLEAGARK
ncbi:MAG: YceI family protein [bacterium]|jgi:polyisoprenoid-binding protein YceI|nr:polyisoprenoid-binding protein [Planctomycetota bacterium]HIL53249.1 polyisoprenoid-binding protein [Planctomycetota bacterium]